MSAHTCYWEVDSISAQALGPPAELAVVTTYVICDTDHNKLVDTVQSGNPTGTLTVTVRLPAATTADVILACQAAIQAEETATPLLAFVAVIA